MTLYERFEKVYNTLRNAGRIHNQKDFAELLGANPASVSRAFAEDPRYLTVKLVKRAESLMEEKPAEQTTGADDAIFIPKETAKLYTNMSESIRLLSETIAKMQGVTFARPDLVRNEDKKG